MEVAGQRELLRLGRAESGDARDLQRQPQPHCAKMARQLGRQVSGRRPDLGLAERADIFATCTEGVGQMLAFADQCRASAVGQEQSLVRVERDAVCLIDPAQQRFPLRRRARTARHKRRRHASRRRICGKAPQSRAADRSLPCRRFRPRRRRATGGCRCGRPGSSACSSACSDIRCLSSVAICLRGDRPRPAICSALSMQ